MATDLQVKLLLEIQDKASAALKALGVEGETAGRRVKSGLGAAATAMGSLQGAARLVTGALAGIGAGVSLSAFAGQIRAAIADLDRLRDQAMITGIEVGKLAGFRFAAEIGGADLGSIQIAIRGLSRAIVEAQQGSAELSAAFKFLGLSAAELAAVPLDEALLRTFDALDKLGSGTDRNAIAQQLLGRSYQELIPFLSQGRAGIEALIAEQQRLNPVTKAMADQADAVADAFRRMKEVWVGVRNEMATALGPTLIAWVGKLASAFLSWDIAVRSVSIGFRDSINWLSQLGKFVGLDIQPFDSEQIDKDVGALADLMTRLQNLEQSAADINRGLSSGSDAAAKSIAGQADAAVKAGQSFADYLKGMKDAEEAAKRVAEANRQAADKMIQDAAAFRTRQLELTVEGNRRLLAEEIASAERLKSLGVLTHQELSDIVSAFTAQRNQKIEELNRKAAEAEIKLRAEIKDSVQKFYDEMAKIDEENNRRRRDALASLASIAPDIAGPETIAAIRALADQELAAWQKLQDDKLISLEQFQAARMAIEDETARKIEDIHRAQAASFADGARQAVDEFAKANTEIERGRRIMSNSIGILTQSFAGLFRQLIDGSVSAKEAFRRFAQDMIARILDLIAQELALAAVQSLLGFGGGFFGGAKTANAGAATGTGALSSMSFGKSALAPAPGSAPKMRGDAGGLEAAAAATPVMETREATVNLVINAVDARSVAQLISQPESQNVITGAVKQAFAQNIQMRQAARSI
jgi:lambda family phage tail tape measure protein